MFAVRRLRRPPSAPADDPTSAARRGVLSRPPVPRAVCFDNSPGACTIIENQIHQVERTLPRQLRDSSTRTGGDLEEPWSRQPVG